MAKKQALGKGLGALLPEMGIQEEISNQEKVWEIPLSQIHPNPNQPRKEFKPESLAELAESIRNFGIMQPLLLMEEPDGQSYMIVAGERRFRAAALAGLEKLPCIVRQLSPSQLAEASLIENIQREDLSPLEEAEAFRSLMDSGLLLDLSGYPELMEYINVLYPLYRDFVSKDGGIYGIPWMANSYNGWFINKKVMKDMGLTAADIPTNLVDMCAFAEKWNTEYAQKYPHYTLLDGTVDYRDRLLKGILELWSDYREANGQEIDLNDPLLKEALSALDAVNLDKLTDGQNQTNPEISDYKQALIWTGCKTVGNWETYMEDFSDRIFIPMTLTADTPYVCPVETVSIWTVNAATKNADYAAALLAEAIKEQIYTYAYALRSDRTEPLVSEYYADTVAAEQKYLEELEARVEESANKATILKRIEDQKKYMATELMQRAYSVTASAVKNYVEVILPACFIEQEDGFADPVQEAEGMGLISRYARRNLTMEEFITRMNEVLDGKIMLTATPVPENMPQ